MIKHLFYTVKILFSILALSFMVACWGDEPDIPTPTPGPDLGPNPPIEQKDTKAPTITVSKSSVNIISGPVVSISGDELKIGDVSVASWKDDKSTTCTVSLTFTGKDGASKAVNSGDKLEEEGKLSLKVTDEAGNSSTAEITLTKTDSEAPKIEVLIQEKNVVAGVKVTVNGNQLLFDSTPAASWTDDYSTTFSIDLAYVPTEGQSKTINSGDILFDAGKLTLSVADEFQNKSTAEITLSSVAVYGLENLQGKTLQVDQEVDLLKGVTFAEGLTLQKVEIEENGVRTEMANPNAYIPQSAGTINIIITLGRSDGSTIEIRVDGLIVKGIDYQAISITDLDPQEILSMFGIEPIEEWDKKAYDHINDLRIAEGMRIRTMMWEYGAGIYSPIQYQELMSRLNLCMYQEVPDKDKFINEYEWIWQPVEWTNINNHAHNELSILSSFAGEFAKIKVVGRDPDTNKFCGDWLLYSFLQNTPNSMNIFCCSGQSASYTWEDFKTYVFRQGFIDLCNSNNGIFFYASGNTQTSDDWIRKEKIYNVIYEAGQDGMYNESSMANSDKNNYPNSHLLVTVGSSKTGEAHMIDNAAGSLFPIGYDDSVLFAGFAFPYYNHNASCFYGEPLQKWSYNSSYTNYINGCVLGLEFQLYADIEDADKLLSMARSTSIENTIFLETNSQHLSQKLQRLSPAKFYKKYCISVNIPSTIQEGEIIPLTKGWYKGLLFSIPGAEILVNGEWITFEAKNKDLILAQNPMNLEWRLNGSLLRKYGYTPGQTIQGQIITVDDQWNGLRLENDFTIQVR